MIAWASLGYSRLFPSQASRNSNGFQVMLEIICPSGWAREERLFMGREIKQPLLIDGLIIGREGKALVFPRIDPGPRD